MAFWGVEIKSGKPYVHRFDEALGRLHVSQATLGFGSSTKKSVVQCSLGDNSPVLLCALLPEKVESCSLSLEFEEEEEVNFSVDGPRSVHLTGFYFGPDNAVNQDSDDSDSYIEDMETGQSSEYDTEDEEEYEGDFHDEVDDDDFEMFPPSPRPRSGVVIEEIHDEEKPVSGDTTQKGPKKKGQKSASDGKNDSQKHIVLKSASTPVLESEDEDGFPIDLSLKDQNGASREKVVQVYKEKKNEAKKAGAAVDRVIKSKRKSDAIEQDGDLDVETSKQVDFLLQSDRSNSEKEGKTKKKQKQKAREGKTSEHGEVLSVDAREENVVDDSNSYMPSTDKIPRAKSDNTLNGIEEAADTRGVESTEFRELAEGEQKPMKKIEDQKSKVQPSKTRTYSNGMVVEELYIGKPDGKRASSGKKVFVRYIGKLKNGKIFDSNISGKPFKFRLGIGEVIKGWDVGVEGMRIGDKRRLTIPPSMGYGSKGMGMIPANSWLIFDVELVDVQ
ncbi:peptidyl-prolyl cis-trans isomerase FKBP53-like isoform X2 [Aristolochia californica]|uniref:peptidyl-prolyl cis-trans isomerase FKBP53-like isoform X2 n=1 Tax=Aristolochia californica TaxID=171875 RepID=UPI0035DC2BED